MTIALENQSNYDSIPQFPDCAADVTPNDAEDFEHPVTLQVMVAGTLRVTPAGRAEGTQINIPAGVAVLGYTLPFRVKRVYSTGTTATVIAIY